MHDQVLERGISRQRGVAVVKKAESNNNERCRSLKLKTAVIAGATAFVIGTALSLLILDWVASTAMGIFMAVLLGVIVTEGGE